MVVGPKMLPLPCEMSRMARAVVVGNRPGSLGAVVEGEVSDEDVMLSMMVSSAVVERYIGVLRSRHWCKMVKGRARRSIDGKCCVIVCMGDSIGSNSIEALRYSDRVDRPGRSLQAEPANRMLEMLSRKAFSCVVVWIPM